MAGFADGPTHLFAVAALRSDPALVARHAVVVVVVWDEGFGAHRLQTAVTREAVLVPRGAAVLQHPRPCHGKTSFIKCPPPPR